MTNFPNVLPPLGSGWFHHPCHLSQAGVGLENSQLFSWAALREEAFQMKSFAMQNVEVRAGISVGSFGPLSVASSCPHARGKQQPWARERKFLLQVLQDVIVGLSTEICPLINLNLFPAQTWKWSKVSNPFLDLSGSSRPGLILVLRGLFAYVLEIWVLMPLWLGEQVWAPLTSSSEWCWSCYK